LGMLLMGGQLLSVGMVAELFIANHEPIQHEYSIKKELEKGTTEQVCADEKTSDDEPTEETETA